MITGDYAVTAAAGSPASWASKARSITGAEFGAMSDEEALAKVGDIGVIARVTPETQGPPGLTCSGRQGAHHRDDRGRRQTTPPPAVKKADIGHRDGHHRHRGDQGSRGG